MSAVLHVTDSLRITIIWTDPVRHQMLDCMRGLEVLTTEEEIDTATVALAAAPQLPEAAACSPSVNAFRNSKGKLVADTPWPWLGI